MANSFGANAFTNNFMQGFSFVDKIQSNKRDEARLEQRLIEERNERAFQKRRTQTQDQERLEDRAFTKLTREEQRARTQEARTATALMSDPDVSDEALSQYAHFPEVSAFIRDRKLKTQERGDLEALFASGQITEEEAAQLQAEQEQTEQPAGLADQVQGNVPPADPFAEERQRHLSPNELNAVAESQGQAAAMQIRDQQAADPKTDQFGVPRYSESRQEQHGNGLPMSPEAIRNENRQKQRDVANQDWGSFNNVNDPAGDPMRNAPSAQSTSMYASVRNGLDADVRTKADKLIQPKIQDTIATQTEIINAAEPGSMDARNAQRIIADARGLKSQIYKEFSALKNAGVTRGGAPVGSNAPEALITSVINEAQNGPLPVSPASAAQQAADHTILSRGATKRINERQAAAAYRFYSGGKMTLTDYSTYMQTGKMPTAPMELKQFDPELDLYAIHPTTGMPIVVKHGTGDPTKSRDIIGSAALSQLNKFAKSYDSNNGDTSGTDAVGGFLNSMSQNTDAWNAAGVNLQDPAVVQQMFQRHMQISVLRTNLNEEWVFNGDVAPDFTERYGSFADAMLGTGKFSIDQDFNREGLEEIDAGFETLTPLPAGARADVNYDAIRQDAGDPSITDAEIDAEIRRRNQ